ncbi:putative bifunctional diguanylate cyclase/phosphodiesterase [Noviherbaspirillum denitrificans]|uniref:Diguanylate cyclase n=1 Tax=Noviherbaspirillum denitrificans TaxID=1968433 RepID=A0A254TNY2_9BURK|nr:bifunctional diguanylate cyclase/phosphodiesterase [Noviherbaspirillum denitrificans]OWW21418.1 diguanylate cyclase [Noviherbaspirillum denitrificans]
MPDQNAIERCLALCREARSLDGAAQLQALSALEAELAGLKGQSPRAKLSEPVIGMDPAGYITSWNDGAERLFGYTPEEAVGQHVLFLYADDDDQVAELFLEEGTSLMEVRRRKKSGEIFWASLALSMTLDEAGHPAGMVARMSEITERLSDEDKLRLHARIIEDSDQGILITDGEERIVSVNTAFTRITGYSAAEAIGKTPDLLRSGKHTADFRAQVRSAMQGAGPWQGEIFGKRKNGDVFPQSVTISVVRNDKGQITHAFSIFSDISVFKEAEARMQRLANYDTLTGLPNRALLNQLVGQALASARRSRSHGALLVINLQRFHSIYDTLGHEVGDALLGEVSARFRHVLRDEDVLARIDGDKFAVALFEIQKREHAGIVANKLLSKLDAPFEIEEHNLRIGASIGISVYPEDGMDTAALLRYADAARVRVHDNGANGYMFYSPEMNERAKEHLWFESELRRALVGNHLQLHYQPKVSLRSGRIVGAEALLRWKHPDRGMVSPGIFIPVAEETGLILELGTWVLDEACRQIRQWQDAGVDVPPVAVNLSSRQFDRHLPDRIQEVLERHGIAADRIKLEITETLLVRGPDTVIPIMNELAARGLALALDDFGTGYSSLAYLKKFPISTLKIDRAFVIGLPQEENDCAIARAIVTMGQQLRQEIVAEGVETPEQMAFLRDLGCDQLQGYLFSPPVVAGDFERMVRDGKRLNLTVTIEQRAAK